MKTTPAKETQAKEATENDLIYRLIRELPLEKVLEAARLAS